MSAAMACGDPTCPCGCGAWMGQCHGGRTGSPPLWLRPTPFYFDVTAPPLLAQALTDTEDDPPAFRDCTMDEQDRETTETIAPDTDRADRDTSPPGPADVEASRAAATMLPAAPSAPAPAPPEYWKAAYDKLCEVHEDQKKDRESRQAREDALVGRFVAAAKENSDADRDNLMTALGEVAKSVEGIATRMVTLEENDAAQGARLADGDKRFAEIENSLADLRAKFETLSADLAKAKANAPARTAPTPPAEPT